MRSLAYPPHVSHVPRAGARCVLRTLISTLHGGVALWRRASWRATVGARSPRPWRVLPALVLLAASATACGDEPLIGELAPGEITVIADGMHQETVGVRYTITATARLTAYLEDAVGRRYLLRDEVLRPPGTYLLPLDATYTLGESGSIRRRVLPDGSYRLVLVARDERRAEEQRAIVRVERADTSPPGLRDVVVSPDTLSPYDPQYEAEATVSYALDEAATVTLAALWPPGQRTVLRPPTWREPGLHAERWSGAAGSVQLPDGVYSLEVEARDRAGNVVAEQVAVRVVGASPPDARITAVRFSPQRLLYGESLCVEITVRNVGSVALRTQGPPPGFTYESSETFASVEGGRFIGRRNYWRVGIDWDADALAESARYPFRWGLGRDLGPGEETTVVGCVRLREPQRTLRVHAALIREGVGYHLHRVGTQVVEIER